MNNRERMLTIISEYKLERLDVAELLSVKRDEVDRWLLPNESSNQLEIPDMAIELLELKVARDKPEA